VKSVTLIHATRMIIIDILRPKNMLAIVFNLFQWKKLKKTHTSVIVGKNIRITLVYGDIKRTAK
jgi:hypothetical protein